MVGETPHKTDAPGLSLMGELPATLASTQAQGRQRLRLFEVTVAVVFLRRLFEVSSVAVVFLRRLFEVSSVAVVFLRRLFEVSVAVVFLRRLFERTTDPATATKHDRCPKVTARRQTGAPGQLQVMAVSNTHKHSETKGFINTPTQHIYTFKTVRVSMVHLHQHVYTFKMV
ncbi:hypothetical protein O3P69_019373 [Scylla paramamosain]|uniref:Uncharacterized protein n=1 Tax=Scylla paramamosain TaxID=85552 RepID=A0AAW0SZL0_SCYPA